MVVTISLFREQSLSSTPLGDLKLNVSGCDDHGQRRIVLQRVKQISYARFGHAGRCATYNIMRDSEKTGDT